MSSSRYLEQTDAEYSRLHKDRDLFWIVPFNVQYVLAVIGYRFAGKTAALEYLAEKHGFQLYSLTAELKRLAVERGVSLARESLQDFGDELRKNSRQNERFAQLALRRVRRDQLAGRGGMLPPPPRIAVGGFKHPDELSLFQRLERFQVIVVQCSAEKRAERSYGSGVLEQELGREIDPDNLQQTFDAEVDKRDREGLDHSSWTAGSGQAVEEMMRVARDKDPYSREPFVIDNEQDRLQNLFDQLDLRVGDLSKLYRAR